MGELNLQNIIKNYLAVQKNKGQADKTIEEKTNSLNRFSNFVNNRPLTPQIALEYMEWLRTKPKNPYMNSSLGTERTHLRTLEKWMIKQRIIQPSDEWTYLLEPPPKAGPKSFLYVYPLLIDDAIIAGTEPKPFRWGVQGDNSINAYHKLEARRCLFLVSRKGLRIIEALRLTIHDLNFDIPKPEFRIAPIKKHVAVWTEIPSDMIEELKELQRLRISQGKTKLFETTERLCNDSLKRGWKAVGLTWPDGEVHNHILRHQFACHLLKSRVPMEKVQIAMRHKSIRVTIDTYGHMANVDVDPLVQQADPRTRRALGFSEQLEFIKSTLESLKLNNETLLSFTKWDEEKKEFILTLRPNLSGQ